MPEQTIASDPPPAPAKARRSDALRNIDTILAVAGRLLADHPRASMQEVAEAAGVHRATVHRHFPSRDDLLAALRRRALDDVQALISDPVLQQGDAAEAIERLSRETLRLGERTRAWRVLPAYDQISDARSEQLGAPLYALMQRGQETGSLRRDLSPQLLATAWGGLVISAMPHVANGVLSIDEGAVYVRRMLSAP